MLHNLYDRTSLGARASVCPTRSPDGLESAAHVFRIHSRVAKSYSAVRPKPFIVMPSTKRGTRDTAKHEGSAICASRPPLRLLERVDSPMFSPNFFS